jgi:hypothetical protein
MSTHNPKTRALVSAFRSGMRPLRAAACQLVDDAVFYSNQPLPAKAIMEVFDASKPTAYGLLNERAKYRKDGRER